MVVPAKLAGRQRVRTSRSELPLQFKVYSSGILLEFFRDSIGAGEHLEAYTWGYIYTPLYPPI